MTFHFILDCYSILKNLKTDIEKPLDLVRRSGPKCCQGGGIKNTIYIFVINSRF